MCLEDIFLVELYNQHGAVEVKEVSNTLGITVNALLSIMNRVMANHPEYILIQKSSDDQRSMISLNKDVESEVKNFLDEGGYTAINEKEFKKYNKGIFHLESFWDDIKRLFKKFSWKKWATGVGITVGAGLAITAGMKSIKDNH